MEGIPRSLRDRFYAAHMGQAYDELKTVVGASPVGSFTSLKAIRAQVDLTYFDEELILEVLDFLGCKQTTFEELFSNEKS